MILRQCTLDDCAEKLGKYLTDKSEKLHSIVGFCAKHYLPKSTFYSWVERDDRLKELAAVSKTIQEYEVSHGALTNDLNAQIAKLILTTNHKYTDRVEQQGNPDRPQQIVDPNAVADDLIKGMKDRGEIDESDL